MELATNNLLPTAPVGVQQTVYYIKCLNWCPVSFLWSLQGEKVTWRCTELERIAIRRLPDEVSVVWSSGNVVCVSSLHQRFILRCCSWHNCVHTEVVSKSVVIWGVCRQNDISSKLNFLVNKKTPSCHVLSENFLHLYFL